jgi:hypothetical protein
MLSKMIYAAIAALAVTSHAPQPVKVAIIVSDAVRSSTLPQTDDLYDVPVHHRYYGRSA